jgi:hypothetical protein
MFTVLYNTMYKLDKREEIFSYMSIFNEKQIKGMLTGEYICSECGNLMEFENENEDTLVCPSCGNDISLDRYGFENDEEYEKLYPTLGDMLGISEDDEPDGETYEEVYGELDD